MTCQCNVCVYADGGAVTPCGSCLAERQAVEVRYVVYADVTWMSDTECIGVYASLRTANAVVEDMLRSRRDLIRVYLIESY